MILPKRPRVPAGSLSAGLVRGRSGRTCEAVAPPGCLPCSSLHSRLFLFPGSASRKGPPVPGFPGGPRRRRRAAQQVVSNAVGPLSLSHPHPVLTHPPLPAVGNPSSHLFPPRHPPPPKRANSTQVGTVPLPRAGSFGRGGNPGGPGALREQGWVTAGSAPRSGGSPSRRRGSRGACFSPSRRRSRPGSALLPLRPRGEDPAGSPHPAARTSPGGLGQNLLRSPFCANFSYLRPSQPSDPLPPTTPR